MTNSEKLWERLRRAQECWHKSVDVPGKDCQSRFYLDECRKIHDELIEIAQFRTEVGLPEEIDYFRKPKSQEEIIEANRNAPIDWARCEEIDNQMFKDAKNDGRS